MARRSGFTHRSQPRRQTSWALGPESSAQNVASSTTQIWTVATVPVIEGLTIVRTRGFIRCLLTTVSAADSGFSGAFGIGVTNQNAVAVGVGSVPTPITDLDWDGWLWHSFFDVRSITATIADGANAVAMEWSMEIDSKAMRKLNDTETAVFGATEVTETGTAVMNIHAQCRQLVKLS